MKIIFIGDVIGESGCGYLMQKLPKLKREYGADFVVVNGENSAKGNGIDLESSEYLFKAGADVITTGNHVWKKNSAADLLEGSVSILRPYNYPDSQEGRGIIVYDMGRIKVGVINLLGTTFMQSLKSPFEAADEAVCKLKEETNIIIVDFHAEATSEKKALLYHLAGRVSAVVGTHTHVQTNDAQIYNGTAYITDAGMTGAVDSIIGMDIKTSLDRFLTLKPSRYKEASGECKLNGVCIEIDEKSGKAKDIELIIR